MTSQTKIKRR